MGGFVQQFFALLKSWLDEPFAEPISALEIFAGLGLILLMLAGWHKIISELKPEL